MAAVEGGQVRLLTKSGADCTISYPEVVRALADLKSAPLVLDGEVTVINAEGLSDFNVFHVKRANRKRVPKGAPPVTFCAFDLLALHGRKTIGLPLEARKRLLHEVLAGVTDSAVKFIGYTPADARVFHAIREAGRPHRGIHGQAAGKQVPARRALGRLAQDQDPRLERGTGVQARAVTLKDPRPHLRDFTTVLEATG